MQTRSAVVVRGTVDAVDPRGVAEQRRINLLGAGFGARTHAYTRHYHPGDLITLEASEIERLIALGICRPISPGT